MDSKNDHGNITVLPADDPKKLKIGWVIEEHTGPHWLPSDDDSCYATDQADAFLDHCGKDIEDPTQHRYCWSSIPMLESLWGQPWNNLALNYVLALRPSAIRVSDGGVTLDCYNWRVTVILEKDKRTIKHIDQECTVSSIGVESGFDLQLKLKQQKTGKKIPKFDSTCCFVNPYALARIELTDVKTSQGEHNGSDNTDAH